MSSKSLKLTASECVPLCSLSLGERADSASCKSCGSASRTCMLHACYRWCLSLSHMPPGAFHRAKRTSDSLGCASLAGSASADKARCRKFRFSFKYFCENVEELEYLASPVAAVHFSNGDRFSLNLKYQKELALYRADI